MARFLKQEDDQFYFYASILEGTLWSPTFVHGDTVT
jgi:hypothetical protein